VRFDIHKFGKEEEPPNLLQIQNSPVSPNDIFGAPPSYTPRRTIPEPQQPTLLPPSA
jgi:hypothetical protein